MFAFSSRFKTRCQRFESLKRGSPKTKADSESNGGGVPFFRLSNDEGKKKIELD